MAEPVVLPPQPPASNTTILILDLLAFPVDTHFLHVTKRLGWIRQNGTAEKVHEILSGLIQPERYHPMHVNLIRQAARFAWRVCRGVRFTR